MSVVRRISMSHQLSSSLTQFYKYVFPVLLGLFMICGIVLETVTNHLSVIEIGLLAMLLLPFQLLVTRWSYRLMDIRLEVDKLIVVRHADEVAIPYERIVQVRQTVWGILYPETVIIELDDDIMLGRRLYFIPTTRYFNFYRHPIVDELNRQIFEGRS
jgi:hypothetical protein